MTTNRLKKIICEKCSQENEPEAINCIRCGNQLYQDYYRGLWLRNTIITMALFLLPFVILFYLIHYEVSKHFEGQVKEGLKYSSEANARVIKSFLSERKTDLLSIAHLNINDVKDLDVYTGFFRRYIVEKPWFDFIAVADPGGDIVFSTNNLKANIKDREYFNKSLNGEFYNSGIFYSPILDTMVMVISSPLYNRHNKIVGIILASICLKTFYDLILDLRIGETSETFLVDSTGTFLSPSKLGGVVLKDLGHHKNSPNPHQGDGATLIHQDYRGEKVICAFRRIPGLNWYLVSEMDVREALAPTTRLKRVMFYIFVIFGCFLIFSSVLFSRRVIYLIRNLTANLKSALDDISRKKNMINTINIELRKRLKDCESLSKQLRNSEEYIKNIINSISSGVIAIDRDFLITYYNESIKQFSFHGDIQLRSPLSKVFPMLGDQRIRTAIDKIFSDKRPFRIGKIPVAIGQANIILSIAGFPIKVVDDILGATLLLSDITKQEHMYSQMADYEKLSALSQLALGAAHEINNPLLGITSYIELLLEDEKDIDRKTRAKEVLDSAYRISETVRGLLDFARPTPPKFTKISLNKLIEETLSFLRHQPLFKKLKIEKKLSEAIPQITADVNQIRQVLINVFINAAQAMPESGRLTVMTNKVKFEDFVEIRVADTGIGIPPDDLNRVFEPFFTTKKGHGTGLGLSISYRYVENHNGVIRIQSTVNKGTEVTISLPIRQEAKIQSEVIE